MVIWADFVVVRRGDPPGSVLSVRGFALATFVLDSSQTFTLSSGSHESGLNNTLTNDDGNKHRRECANIQGQRKVIRQRRE